VQQLEQNVRRVQFGTLLLAVAVLTAPAAIGAPKDSASILHDKPPHPCMAGADYVAGIDANGDPVVPADAGAGPVPVPPQVVMALPGRPGARGNQGYVVLDGGQIAPLLNPPPCRD